MNHKNFIKKMNSNKHKLRHACLLFHVINKYIISSMDAEI